MGQDQSWTWIGFIHGLNWIGSDNRYSFLADRTNGRAYATVLRLSSVVRL